MLQSSRSEELANASKMEGGVRFYQTSNPDVAKLFHIDPEAERPALVLFLNRAEDRFTLYGMCCRLHLKIRQPDRFFSSTFRLLGCM